MKNMEKLVKAILNSDKFQELKDILPSVYHLTRLLAKDVEYDSVSPELEERVKRHFQYVWKYVNLPDDMSLTGPETAFMKDMQKNMKVIKSVMNDLRRANTFGEGKTMKITKKQMNKLIESIVEDLCGDDELNESELSPDPEWEGIQSAPLHQHYPGSFEQDGTRPDLRESRNIRWDNGIYKAAISANQTAEMLGKLISHSSGLNENQLLKLKQVHDKAVQLAKFVEIMKNWM